MHCELYVSEVSRAEQLDPISTPRSAPPMTFQINLFSGGNAARHALDQVLSALEPFELDPEEVGTIQLVLAEILNNVVEHAYPAAAPDGPIQVKCKHHADGLHFAIEDEGKPMPAGAIPIGDRPEVNVETADLPEGGFGWFLIKELAKDITYCRNGDKNQLSLRIAVACDPATLKDATSLT